MSDPETPDRRRPRRRFAAVCGILAAVLLVGGVLGARASDDGLVHTLGVAAVGYGVGMGVAAAFLAAGWNPIRRR
jgi:hypothetical protein